MCGIYRHAQLKLFVFERYSQKVVTDQFLASLESGNRMRSRTLRTDTLTRGGKPPPRGGERGSHQSHRPIDRVQTPVVRAEPPT